MRKRRKPAGIRSNLNRIERKCDLILSQILIANRSRNNRNAEVDSLLDRLHSTARRLREQSEEERERVMRMFPESTHSNEG